MVSTNCKKYLCCFYCIILGISGVCWIVVSSVLLYRLLNYRIFIPGEAIGPFGLFIFLGFLHILITWVGWKGVTREHGFHIIMFSVLVGTIVLAEIGTGIWSMIVRDEVDLHAVGILDTSFKEYIAEEFDKKDWVKLQRQLHCCGIDGPSGYGSKGYVPTVCCNIEKSINGSCIEMYQTGCKKPLIKYIKGLLLSLALFAFVSGVFQCVGVYAYYNLEVTLRRDCKRARQRDQNPSAPAGPLPPHIPHVHPRAPPPPIPQQRN